jgi:hypothetical protein
MVEFLTDPAGTIQRLPAARQRSAEAANIQRRILEQPRVSPEGAGAAPGQLTGGGVNVTLEPGAVQVAGGGQSPEEIARAAAEEVERAIREALVAAEAQTDPGPNRLVQGAGR